MQHLIYALKLAKGRTNIELREQFILADGVSQTMTAFRSKPNLTSSFLRTQLSSAGPITKVSSLIIINLFILLFFDADNFILI